MKYFSIIIFSISVYLLFKAVSLFNFQRDGDGIGIYIFGLELNDRVLNEQVPKYSFSFLVIGLILVIISAIAYYKSKTYRVS